MCRHRSVGPRQLVVGLTIGADAPSVPFAFIRGIGAYLRFLFLIPAAASARPAPVQLLRDADRAYAPWHHAPMRSPDAAHRRHAARACADPGTSPPSGTVRRSPAAR